MPALVTGCVRSLRECARFTRPRSFSPTRHRSNVQVRSSSELGFSDLIVPLDNETRQRLGIATEVDSPHMSLGPGSMRALVASLKGADSVQFVTPSPGSPSDCHHAPRTSSGFVIVIHPAGRQIAIGSWYTGPKLAARGCAHRVRRITSSTVIPKRSVRFRPRQAAPTSRLTRGGWRSSGARQSAESFSAQCIRRVIELARSLSAGQRRTMEPRAGSALSVATPLSVIHRDKGLARWRSRVPRRTSYADCMVSGGPISRQGSCAAVLRNAQHAAAQARAAVALVRPNPVPERRICSRALLSSAHWATRVFTDEALGRRLRGASYADTGSPRARTARCGRRQRSIPRCSARRSSR